MVRRLLTRGAYLRSGTCLRKYDTQNSLSAFSNIKQSDIKYISHSLQVPMPIVSHLNHKLCTSNAYQKQHVVVIMELSK